MFGRPALDHRDGPRRHRGPIISSIITTATITITITITSVSSIIRITSITSCLVVYYY